MKILFCLNHFMPQHTGGTEVYTMVLGKALAEKGHDITVVIPNFESDSTIEYVYEGLKVIKYRQPENKPLSVLSRKTGPSGLKDFKEIVKRINPDLAHIQEISDKSGIGLLHLRILHALQIKTYYTIHIPGVTCYVKTLIREEKYLCSGVIDIPTCTKCALSYAIPSPAKRDLLNTAAMGLYNINLDIGKFKVHVPRSFELPFLIEDMRTRLKEIESLCEKIIVITDWYKEVLHVNNVDPAKIVLIKQALPHAIPVITPRPYTPEYPIKLMFIGRINAHKGLHLLLEAVADLPEEKISVDIFGAAKDTPYYNGLKKSTELKTNVHWRGFLAKEDVITTMTGFDAMVLASIAEMSPLVIEEASAAGIPTIGSNTPAIAEQVKDHVNGFLFDFSDSASLRRVLSSIIDNPEQLQSVRKNISVPDDFALVVDQYLAVYG